jgi:dihydroxyacid dehydratase/phosphogluconate dehydratase
MKNTKKNNKANAEQIPKESTIKKSVSSIKAILPEYLEYEKISREKAFRNAVKRAMSGAHLARFRKGLST